MEIEEGALFFLHFVCSKCEKCGKTCTIAARQKLTQQILSTYAAAAVVAERRAPADAIVSGPKITKNYTSRRGERVYVFCSGRACSQNFIRWCLRALSTFNDCNQITPSAFCAIPSIGCLFANLQEPTPENKLNLPTTTVQKKLFVNYSRLYHFTQIKARVNGLYEYILKPLNQIYWFSQ